MGIAGIGKGGALFGTGTTAAFVDLGLAPGTTDQREDLSFRKSLTSVATLQHFFQSVAQQPVLKAQHGNFDAQGEFVF